MTYAGLDLRARALAVALRREVYPGDRILLLFPPGLDFIAAFFGCLYAGAIAVPLYPPNLRRDSARLSAVVRDCSPRAVLTTAALAARAREVADLPPLAWIATDVDSAAEDWRDPGATRETVAFLQYTSGSTGDPKGVVVTHGNLLHNEEAIRRTFQQDAGSRIVGWLPLYHDMGLIGNVLQPLWVGASCILMAPVAFLQRPRRWLEAISRYRATTSGGPDFAYALCTRKISPAEREGLDLSSWKVAFSGAEPVRDATLARFAEAFAPCGFSPRAFHPCYGLAEATLLVAGAGAAEPYRAPAFDAAALGRDRVEAAVAGRAAVRLVGNGVPFAEQRIVIVDPATGEPCAPGAVGEIWLQGPGVARGYWNRPEETERTFGARLAGGDGPFLRTGDLGFLAAGEGGELFVTGRLKDLIILRGRNLYPQDVERCVEGVHPVLRPDGAAAFAVDDRDEERLVIVLEVEPRARGRVSESAGDVARAVRQAVAEEHEVQVWDVVLIPAGELPRTTSGKVRRRACREKLLQGELELLARCPLEAEGAAVESAGAGLSSAALRALDPADRPAVLTAWLRAQAARALRVPETEIDPGRSLTALGLDSLAAVELAHAVETALGAAPALADLLAGATLEELAAGLALRLDEPRTSEEAAAVGPETGDHPLSGGQEALWFLERLAPGSGAYHIAGAAHVAAGLDRGAFERAVRRLAARHPALRTVLVAPEGRPVQRVLSRLDPDLAWGDATAGSEGAALARLEEDAARPFDLERGPLLRLLGLERPGGEHLVGLTVHHAVADFWSLGVMVRELGALYREETGGGPARLAPLAARFSDHARREALRLASPAGARAIAWWEERLAGAPVLDLPSDRPRPPVQTWRGGAVGMRLEAPVAAAIEALAPRSGATLFMVLLAGLQALLHRYSGQDDFVVGAPTAGRGEAAFADVVGYFVNPLPLRTPLAGNLPFAELLERTRETVLASFAHQEVPFARIAAALQPERDPARPPVFQVLFVLHRAARPEEEALAAFALGEAGARLDLGGLAASSLPRKRHAPQLDLTLAAARLGGAIALSLEHNGDLFDPATAARLLRHLAHLLTAAAEGPREPLAHLPLLAPVERKELLGAAVTPPGVVPEACLHELVAAQARRTPDATAVIGPGDGGGAERLTYAELVDRAEQLARHLAALGVGPEIPVALAARRAPDLVCGMLGILAAGGAYVPLDPAYPRERLAFMLEDSGAAALVTEDAVLPALPAAAVPVLRLGALPATAGPPAAERRRAVPGNLAYLIYTSGSTGRPKGVAIEHRSAAALVAWAREAFAPAELAGVLASTSVCFDLSVFEIFVPLACGGTVILAANALELPRLAAAGEVTLVNTVPSVIAELDALPPAVRTVCLAGEALLAPLVRRLEAGGRIDRILNLYGPTEDTTYSTWAEVQGRPVPTIGRPLPGTQAQVLDNALEPAPPGVVGELWLGGSGLARGYHGRPELTADRFRPAVWGEPGARLYRTGDLVRRLPDGELEYLGRSDHQVKIRGFRVELGEIEAALTRHPAVRQAAALALRDGPGGLPRLAAWVGAPGLEPEAGEALRRELLAGLRETLPQALRPQALVVLPALPLTPNGKIDRRALPAPEPAAAAGPAPEPPATPAEELVAEVLAEVLGVATIGRHDDFFAAGGHSLLAARAIARLERAFGRELPVIALFQTPTVAGLAERLAGPAAAAAAAPPLVAVPRVPRDAPLPLSFAQERLWLLHQLDPESAAYHVPGALELAGPLCLPALAAALCEIVRRHEALRTSFLAAGGRPVQTIAPPPRQIPWEIALPRIDLDGLPAEAAAAEAERICGAIARQPFDLARAPLARWALLRLGPRTHRLAVVFHHIVSDGASFEVFLRELAALYGALAGGPSADRSAPLAPLPIQLADVAAWQRRVLADEALRAPLGWWRERLAGLPVLELPTDRPRRTAGAADRGAARAFSLDAAEALRPLCRAEGATLFMALLAAFSALLGRLARQTDVPVGTPVSTRGRVETEGLIGLLIDTLVLRADLGGAPTGRELLHRSRRTVLEAHARAVPFERLVDELNPERTLHHSPLFQVMLAFLHTGAPRTAAGGLEIGFREVETGTAKFDLSLWVRQSGDRLGGHLVYRSELWDAATPARWEGHFLSLIRGLAEAPDRPLAELPLLTVAERHQLEREWNATALPVDAGRCLHELFAARVAAAPDAPALLAAGGSLSFRELDRRANRAARRLRALGVGPDVPVGLCADRSPEALVALLAVWKAGGAYLPLDPAYPRERLEMVLADAGARVLVTRPELLAAPPEIPVLPYSALESPGAAEDDAAPVVAVPPDCLAYVIYTSGSTGRPKGTLVCHRSVAHLLAALRQAVYRELPRGGAPLRVGVNASLAFDASVKQIIQLLDGHALSFVPEEDRLEGRRLIAFCRERGLDVLDCTPAQLRVLLAAVDGAGAAAGGAEAGRLPLLLVGGEAIDEALWRDMTRWSEAQRGAGFWNVYGPTECTVDATACRVEGDRPVLGHPIANVRVHLLDGELRPVPLGVPGELCIAGAGVARGYHRRPDLTALRFVPDPLAAQPGERLYRTGDLARRRPDGRLEFLGRDDGQVKIRGFRVELGEIEAALAAHPAVEQAVVLLRGPLLVGYTTGPGDLGEEEIRAFLAPRLPAAMLPARCVRLERFPLNPSGKVDRRALPDPGASPRGSVPPRTPVEERIAEVWRNLLGRSDVGVKDSFFALGGHSLLVAQLASRLRQELGVEIPLRRLFEGPTIEKIAAAVATGQAAAPRAAPIKAQLRGRRNLSQLVGEVGSLSTEQIQERLRSGERSDRRSS